MDVPDGYELVLTGRGDKWTARLIPDGHTASKWSPPAIQAKARSFEEAIEAVIGKARNRIPVVPR